LLLPKFSLNKRSILQGHKLKLPVVNATYKLVGLITFRDITKLTQNQLLIKMFGRLRVAAAIGVTGDAVQEQKPW
jgi:IMP dehydrogenase